MTVLSVVVPTYNRPGSLERLLSSILASEPLPGRLEILVVDDGSPDHVYDGLMAAFPTVRWIREQRAGPATARNRGWRKAKGDVIVFIDDDCVIAHSTLRHLRDALGEFDAVGAAIRPLNRGRLVADYMHAEHLVSHKVEDGRVRWLVTACLAVRRPVLDHVGGFDEQLTHPGGEDVDLSLRLRQGGFRLAVCDEAVVYHDHRPGLLHLVRTYYRHGTGQRRLATRHPERRADLVRSTQARLSPAAWFHAYRAYRADEDVLTSLVFVLMRIGMMVPWLFGALRGPTSRMNR